MLLQICTLKVQIVIITSIVACVRARARGCVCVCVCVCLYTLEKLSTWFFKHSSDISCSLLVNWSHNDESWEGGNTCLRRYRYNDLVNLAEFVLKSNFLNLATKLSNRSLLLELNLLLHTPVFIWKKLRQIFLKLRSFNHLYCWDILMISFLFGRMEKQNLEGLNNFLPNLIFPYESWKKRVAFLDLNVSL